MSAITFELAFSLTFVMGELTQRYQLRPTPANCLLILLYFTRVELYALKP